MGRVAGNARHSMKQYGSRGIVVWAGEGAAKVMPNSLMGRKQ